jgi:hypothetical protein
MRQIYANTRQKKGQRNGFKSVRGSNHRVQEAPGRLLAPNEHFHVFSLQASGKAVWTAPIDQQEASRTGAKENR